MYVASVMTPNPVTISAKASMMEAAKKMRDNGIGSLVVVIGEKIESIITERDIVNCVASRKDVNSSRVEDFMSNDLVTAELDTTVEDAATLMLDNNIKKLPVVDKGTLMGIVTERDLMKIIRILHNSPDWEAIQAAN